MFSSDTQKALSAFEKGDFNQAISLFEAAEKTAREKEDWVLAAELANNRSVALLKSGDAKSALAACQGTEEIFRQAGEKKKEAMAHGNMAAAYEGIGQLEMAIDHYHICSQMLKELGENELRVYVLKNLSALQLRKGDQLQSLATMQAALNIETKPTLVERLLKKLLKIPFKSR